MNPIQILSFCNCDNPEQEPGAFDLGNGFFISWHKDNGGFIWHHTGCRQWSVLRFVPDPDSTGHSLVSGGPHDMKALTIGGSLVCPMGCGLHGFIVSGKWIKV